MLIQVIEEGETWTHDTLSRKLHRYAKCHRVQGHKIICLWTYLFSWSVYTARGRYQILQNLIKANHGVNRKFSELNWSVQGFNAFSTLRKWTLLIWIFFRNSKENCFETFNFKTSRSSKAAFNSKLKKNKFLTLRGPGKHGSIF